jgi:hypothetical protein
MKVEGGKRKKCFANMQGQPKGPKSGRQLELDRLVGGVADDRFPPRRPEMPSIFILFLQGGLLFRL